MLTWNLAFHVTAGWTSMRRACGELEVQHYVLLVWLPGRFLAEGRAIKLNGWKAYAYQR